MKILDIQIIRGANYWSNYRHQLVVMKLDLEEMEEQPSDEIPGFAERLQQLIPSLYEHHCSEGHEGGFLERVQYGTWMGHIAEHIALEIQTLAGMPCGFGRTRGTGDYGIYEVVFSYREERAGIYAAKAAVSILQALIGNKPYSLEQDIQALKQIRCEDQPGPSTAAILAEASRRNIPHIRLHRDSLIQLGYGCHQKLISATITSQTSGIGIDLSCDKEDAKRILSDAGIPVPVGTIISTKKQLKTAVQDIGFPLVIKPVDGNQGKGATINITSVKEAEIAFETARKYARRIVAERYVAGADFRMLVVNYQLVAAAKRTAAHVVGDGISTIQQLIAIANADCRRGNGHENVLTQIPLNDTTLEMLRKKKLTPESVLPPNKKIYLQPTANLSTGGTSTNVTDTVHPYNKMMAGRIAKIMGMDICGIDLIAPNLATPINETGGMILEVNAAPGFRMHLAPTKGKPVNVAEPVIDMLFPKGSQVKIPIIAITGTNGKTTTTRLVAHIMSHADRKVGFTTSDGIYIQNQLLQKGDCTGPKSAKFVLRDPTVDCAVLEVARGGILREGLGFAQCDIGIVTNIASDHLGMKGIHTLEQLAKVKSVVVENVSPEGHAILNADDDHVFDMRHYVKSHVALFSLDGNNPRIVVHLAQGGIAAVLENNYIVFYDGNKRVPLEPVNSIPLTFCGKCDFMTENVLAAALAAFLRGIPLHLIRESLRSFIPSPAQTPGRMNLFEFDHFKFLLDYAHNPAGMEAIGKFLSKLKNHPKVGIISGTGDRRDEDIIDLGRVSARVFDEIVIRREGILRGRNPQELIDLMTRGIFEVDPEKPVTIVEHEKEAIESTINGATPGTFITLVSDDIPEAIRYLTNLKEKESKPVLKKKPLINGRIVRNQPTAPI